jgi:translation initiation factor 1A
MTKKQTQSKPFSRKLRLPRKDEQFAVVVEMSGGSRMKALCADNKTRMIRIGGKLKKRMWCRENDLIIVKPWVIQSDQKADLVHRYLPTERNRVLHKIPEELNIWQT